MHSRSFPIPPINKPCNCIGSENRKCIPLGTEPTFFYFFYSRNPFPFPFPFHFPSLSFFNHSTYTNRILLVTENTTYAWLWLFHSSTVLKSKTPFCFANGKTNAIKKGAQPFGALGSHIQKSPTAETREKLFLL